MFNSKVVFLTGGTGSFGTKFIEILLNKYSPSKIIVYSRDELKQYDMQQKFAAHLDILHFVIGDVRDQARLIQKTQGVDIIVHAAALKQVGCAEYNPFECIQTNVHGAENIVRAAIANQVSQVIALSTDKAASPVNIYGASKLASDKIFVSANNDSGPKGPKFAVVRYGNVLGSRGSVIPLFKRMIEAGAQDLPITELDMTRFWITLEQGVEFVIKSLERMQGGEIFIPKIASSTIVDLATAMAPDLPIRVVGIRPGEKLHEVMCPSDESHLTLEFSDHFVIQPSISFFNNPKDYTVNLLSEKGTLVVKGFEYNSFNNSHKLSVSELKTLLLEEKWITAPTHVSPMGDKV